MKNGREKILALVTLLTAGIVRPEQVDAFENHVTISQCVLTPYDLRLTITDVQTSHTTDHHLHAGRCEDVQLEIGEKGAVFSVVAIPSDSLARLIQYPFFSEAWNGLPIVSTGGSGVEVCVDHRTGTLAETGWLGTCKSTSKRTELGFLPGNASQHFLFLDDPHVCKQASIDCANDDMGDLLTWASALEDSLSISWRAQNPLFEHGLIPTETGLATVDANGPFRRGISVDYRVATHTPFGSPIYATAGDTILTFNGQPVFDKDSFIILSIEHGMNAGYENPYSMQILRDGQIYDLQGYTGFHRGTFGSIFMDGSGICRVKTRAALSSALNEATLYTAPILGCSSYDLEGMSISRREQCEFAYRQLLAAYRQWCPDVSQYASIVGAIVMPGRQGAETVMRRFGLRHLGKLAAPLAVEAVEETARALMTLPPGIRAEDNIESITQQIGFGMIVGQVASQGIRLISKN